MRTRDAPAGSEEPLTGTLNVMSWVVAETGLVTTVRAEKTGRLMVLEFGHEPLTTKFWLRAEKANSLLDRVRKGLADGILPFCLSHVSKLNWNLRGCAGLTYLKKPVCSPSLPMTEPMIGTTAAAPF